MPTFRAIVQRAFDECLQARADSDDRIAALARIACAREHIPFDAAAFLEALTNIRAARDRAATHFLEEYKRTIARLKAMH